MRYLLLIYGPEADEQPPDDQIQAEMAAYNAFTQEVRDRGLYESAEALQPTATATTVRVRDGRTITTDGPFAETKEGLGGFYQNVFVLCENGLGGGVGFIDDSSDRAIDIFCRALAVIFFAIANVS